MTPSRRTPPRLVALTPGRGAEPLSALVGAAVEGGLEGLVLREPSLADGAFLALARRLRPLVRWLALHDRPHLALAAGADAVHLGFRSLAPTEARRVVPGEVALGRSCHAEDDPAALGDVDYVTFGPVFATPSKAGLREPTGVAALRAFADAAPCPVLALGGLTAERAAACRAAGAFGVAAIGDLLGASDPAARARAFGSALATAENGGADARAEERR